MIQWPHIQPDPSAYSPSLPILPFPFFFTIDGHTQMVNWFDIFI